MKKVKKYFILDAKKSIIHTETDGAKTFVLKLVSTTTLCARTFSITKLSMTHSTTTSNLTTVSIMAPSIVTQLNEYII